MTEPTPSQRVMEEFVPWMKAKGYTYRKTGHKFTREIGCARLQFGVGFDGRGGLVSTDASIYLDFPKVAALYQRATGEMGFLEKGGGLEAFGCNPSSYFIFTAPYDGMTPVQKKGISSMLIHPQERVEGAIRFLQNAVEQCAQPMFEQTGTYRQMIDDVMVLVRKGRPSSVRNFPSAIGCVYLLNMFLNEDNAELVDLVGSSVPPAWAAQYQSMITKVLDFAATADPATFDL